MSRKKLLMMKKIENERDTIRRKIHSYAFQDNNWIRVSYLYLKFLSPIEAIVFSFIQYDQNKYAEKPQLYEKYNGWFYIKTDIMKEKLGIPRITQYKVLERLKKIGLIRTKKTGMPPKRFIWINYKLLERMINNFYEEKINDPEKKKEDEHDV